MTTRHRSPRRPPVVRTVVRPVTRVLAPVLAPVLLLLALTGCSGGSGPEGSSVSSGSSAAGADAAGGAATEQAAAPSSGSGTARTALQERAVVSTGSVSLRSKDVASVRSRVDRLLAAYDGLAADEQTSTDRRGRVESTTLTLRVPSRSFEEVQTRLARLGTLVDSSRSAQDVTTRVVDVRARIAAERIGLRRLEQLMARSGSLADLLAVEKQVTERRASLDSLEQQRAYLDDQTSLATITLTVDRTATPAPAHAHGGFLAGLRDGWTALVAVVAGLLRGAGAALPFALVALVLWLPARAVVRRVRRGVQPSAGPAS